MMVVEIATAAGYLPLAGFSYFVGRRMALPKRQEHQHVWGNWEDPVEVTLLWGGRSVQKIAQPRFCLGCNVKELRLVKAINMEKS